MNKIHKIAFFIIIKLKEIEEYSIDIGMTETRRRADTRASAKARASRHRGHRGIFLIALHRKYIEKLSLIVLRKGKSKSFLSM